MTDEHFKKSDFYERSLVIDRTLRSNILRVLIAKAKLQSIIVQQTILNEGNEKVNQMLTELDKKLHSSNEEDK
ncbi:MAG TPA: hypothetical protein VI819_05750 [Patescibacteria group bacterium]|nr:hypothetical protein [Patescibacteria group bacterium]